MLLFVKLENKNCSYYSLIAWVFDKGFQPFLVFVKNSIIIIYQQANKIIYPTNIYLLKVNNIKHYKKV